MTSLVREVASQDEIISLASYKLQSTISFVPSLSCLKDHLLTIKSSAPSPVATNTSATTPVLSMTPSPAESVHDTENIPTTPQFSDSGSVPNTFSKRHTVIVNNPELLSSIPAPALKRTGSNLVTNSFQALRKKIGSEMSKKKPTPTRTGSQRASATPTKISRAMVPGSVATLRPSPAMTVAEHVSVAEAAQLCAAKRVDCVLVINAQRQLTGIFTAKDLAYRVVAADIDPRSITVVDIMTRDPMVTNDTSSATEALEIMVKRGFRHLVCQKFDIQQADCLNMVLSLSVTNTEM